MSVVNRYIIVFVPASVLAKAILGYWCLASNVLHSPLPSWEELLPFVQESGGIPGLAWVCEENVAPSSIQIPYFPSYSSLLYQLCCCCPHLWKIYCLYIFLCIQKLKRCFIINLDHIPRQPIAVEWQMYWSVSDCFKLLNNLWVTNSVSSMEIALWFLSHKLLRIYIL